MTSTASGPRPLRKVLIANRGEIAVRIARACRDAGLTSVGVYADPDRTALHATLTDEAYALGGARAAETYLDIAKLLDVARRSGADSVHPGYGFLAENADFARAVIDAGLVWIGPPPAAIDALGDKVSARHIAQRAGAPLVAGTPDPVESPQEVLDFAAEHGLPIAIKAAFGGGGRGLKVAHTAEEIPDLFESAVREATASFGRGECFVERFLDRPRHVETQCLADDHGTVVVVSTRDCSLQRRHQKLVEEAPAPFLSEEQNEQLRTASIAILTEAGYRGAGTCEFLVGTDGTISFLEVNTRLQVEHTVTEEVSGIDLVREQFRIAAGEPLGYTEVPLRGHSFEFRINGEDPYAGFLPAPGTLTTLDWPSGPGVRVDSGVRAGDTISGAFDSMIAKLVVTGATRAEALQRARRALDETAIVGLPTVVPFHRAMVSHPAFTAESGDFGVYTTWIESEFIDGFTRPEDAPVATPVEAPEPEEAVERVVVEVGGKRLEVVLPAGLGLGSAKRNGPRKPTRRSGHRTATKVSGNALACPMQGTIVKVAVTDGDVVAEGDLVVVLEAMKMEQPLFAHRAGRIHGLTAGPGQSISAGGIICQIDDAGSE
ncbi:MULTISPECIES: biotin carboxylase N-terminal domain-containing protein [unclassified Pseudactinotalea]|uniref:acetyl/propionyl/methylcrotonyl-CoA carboxylase subunit alpha n=1 Tax=unclassified Pseudactinotalea TaxID=2649176 RepID=UPI00128C498A|nr:MULTISPECIES: biotin carboxylase N-terminal domain-containing protein [unclassified Pseudactinotalea]MPV48799.1 ATP-grasp domain-containing protein [Pseudactinotalea sp. HY160]QGH68782.1 ATP-grasp domain-containing protein [Pseudactinotalea sp. HY158]